VFGDIRDGRDVPVRLQVESVIDDVFGTGEAMRRVLHRIASGGRGIVIYLREGAVGVAGRQQAAPDEEHASARGRVQEWREVGVGAQILRDLGVSSIRLLTSKPRRYVGLDGFGIAIDGIEPVEG